jgi:hypothetical protein
MPMLKKKVPLMKRYRQRFKVKPAPMWEALIVVLLGCVLIYSYSFAKKVVQAGDVGSTDPSGPPQVVRVQVLNGCGRSGVAKKIADELRTAGNVSFEFDVVDQGNFATFDVNETLVIDRGSSAEAALEIASMYGLPRDRVVRQPLSDNFLGVEVSFLLGKDVSQFQKRRP